MANLSIDTKLNRVLIIGTFCNWEISKAIEAKRVNKAKKIVVKDLPACEYKVLAARDWLSEEKPIKSNRLFTATHDETIIVNF